MWIRSQDKTEMVNVIRLEIGVLIGDKSNKSILWGVFAPDTFFNTNKVQLGKFATKEDAIKEIDNIQEYFLQNPNGIYSII